MELSSSKNHWLQAENLTAYCIKNLPRLGAKGYNLLTSGVEPRAIIPIVKGCWT
jgi:hypothetical protein